MATLALKKNLSGTYKKETILNVGLLSKIKPIFPELNRIIFKENALEKPTQNLFNNLTYYLVSIIDPQVHASFTWPLYDTKAERAYRSEVSNFINNYSSKGLLAPVLSSYLVNPSSYKVTVLMYQLSQLAVHEMVKIGLKESQKKQYLDMTEKYKTQRDDFVESIDKETNRMQNNFSRYLHKRKVIENMAELFRNKIKDMESKLSVLKSQEYIDNLVDDYIANHNVNEDIKTEILKIKNVHEQSKFFDCWLLNVDSQIDAMVGAWDKKVYPFLSMCRCIFEQTDDLIKRYTGQVEKNLYTIEYDPKSDEICTKELQAQVNSQQKFILKNLDKNGRLNFPNLFRAYIISISFILKNNEVGHEIFKFNEYLDVSKRNYKEVVLGLRSLICRILNAETRLEPPSITYNKSMSITDYPEIPPLPDITDLKINRGQNNITTDVYTPLNINKHQFSILRRTNETFTKPLHRNLAPIYQAPKDDFLKSLISCRVSAYDCTNITHDSYNKTVISSHKGHETIAECSTGFTKQQILRLLSNKKSSSSKKFGKKQERPVIKKKGALFDESILSNESNSLFRSYSSPNLFENREPINKAKGRKLSIMKEDSQSQFDMTGIASLDIDSNFNTPQGIAESSRKEIDSSNTPVICITNAAEERIINVLNNMNNEIGNNMISPILEASPILEVSPMLEMSPILEVTPVLEVTKINLEEEMQSLKVETPQSKLQPIKKTSSLEKIINRFKKVRASVVPENDEIKTIVEEKENFKFNNLTNRVLLPDLLSPSCSNNLKPNVNLNYLDQLCMDMDKVASRRPRESLGTALGVDQTFLDQFDLID